jgi:hypothetical protein
MVIDSEPSSAAAVRSEAAACLAETGKSSLPMAQKSRKSLRDRASHGVSGCPAVMNHDAVGRGG